MWICKARGRVRCRNAIHRRSENSEPRAGFQRWCGVAGLAPAEKVRASNRPSNSGQDRMHIYDTALWLPAARERELWTRPTSDRAKPVPGSRVSMTFSSVGFRGVTCSYSKAIQAPGRPPWRFASFCRERNTANSASTLPCRRPSQNSGQAPRPTGGRSTRTLKSSSWCRLRACSRLIRSRHFCTRPTLSWAKRRD